MKNEGLLSRSFFLYFSPWQLPLLFIVNIFLFQNKAILTLDGRTSKILVANEIAGKLFGYFNDELTGMKVSELFTMKDGFKQNALLEQHIDTEGNIVMISGKVVSYV